MSNGGFNNSIDAVTASEKARMEGEQAVIIAQLEAYLAFLMPYDDEKVVQGLGDGELMQLKGKLQNIWNYLARVGNSYNFRLNPRVASLHDKVKDVYERVHLYTMTEIHKRGLEKKDGKDDDGKIKIEGPIIPPIIDHTPIEER